MSSGGGGEGEEIVYLTCRALSSDQVTLGTEVSGMIKVVGKNGL